MELNGIYTALITPFNDDFSINEEEYQKVINPIIDEGVHGIVVAGSTGENYAQSLEERLQLADLSSKIVNNRVKLILGVGGFSRTEDSIIVGKKAKEIGADAIMISSPPYAVPTSEENAANSLYINKEINLPILLYNYPGRTSVNMDKKYLDIVSRENNFIGIKESSGEIERINFLIKNYPSIQLCCGMDDQAFDYFKGGAKSWVCAGSNFSAKAHLALWKTCVVEKNFDKGLKIWEAMKPLMINLEQGGKFIQSIKYATSLRGIKSEQVRMPLQGLNDEEKLGLRNIIEEMNLKIEKIMNE